MSADNEGQKSATNGIPDLTTLPPAKARRVWLNYLADGEFIEGGASVAGAFVTLAINEYELNFGKAGEEISRKNLVDRMTKLREAIAAKLVTAD